MSKCTIIIPSSLTSVFAQDMRASALDCTAVSQIFEQSLTARGKHSLSRIWLRRWKTDSWIRPLFSQTLELSLGKNSLKSWLEEFSRLGGLVSPLVAQANAKQPRMNVGSLTLLQMELPLCGPVSFSPKTSKGYYQQKCQTALPFLATASRDWKAYITELRQAYSARLNAERLTRESESSSWPTSSARDWKGCYTTLQRKDGKMRGDLLPDAVNLEEKHGRPAPGNWPTPNCMDVITPNRDLTQMESKGHWGKNMNTGKLSEMVNYGPPVPASSSTDGSRPGLWQTATVSTGAHRQKDGSMTDKLDQQVKSWATPRAGKTTDENPETWALRQAKGDVATMPLTAQVKNHTSGKLNPRWVETLMGLPVGWTMPSCASPVTIERMSSDCLGMESCRQQQNEPSGL